MQHRLISTSNLGALSRSVGTLSPLRTPFIRSEYTPKRLLHESLVAETAEITISEEAGPTASNTEEGRVIANFSNQPPIEWAKHWYAVSPANLIDPSRPNPVKVLGKNLVIWLDAQGNWRCFEDKCPHRAAPLSEGKLWPERNTLACSYHGWEFDGEGQCTRIPQAASPEAEKAACSSLRSCALAYPIIESQGILFVYPDSSSNAHTECDSVPIPIDSLYQGALERGDEVLTMMPPYFRDVPYDYQTLVENVLDPAHVAFAHHNVQGNRNKVKFGDYELRIVGTDTNNGNNGSSDPVRIKATYSSFAGEGYIAFESPGIINYYTENRETNEYFSFRIYCTPTAPGQSRLVSRITTNRKGIPPLFKLIRKIPLWMDHLLFRHAVLDGDNVFLHYQEHEVVEKAKELEDLQGADAMQANAKSWTSSYFLATRADMLVLAFKKWLDGAARGGPFGPLHKARGYPPLITDHRVILNRYDQHTKHCRVCKKALENIEKLRPVAAAIAAIGLGSAVSATVMNMHAGMTMAKAVMTQSVAGAALVGFLFALTWRWLSSLREKFYFVDYDHATR